LGEEGSHKKLCQLPEHKAPFGKTVSKDLGKERKSSVKKKNVALCGKEKVQNWGESGFFRVKKKRDNRKNLEPQLNTKQTEELHGGKKYPGRDLEKLNRGGAPRESSPEDHGAEETPPPGVWANWGRKCRKYTTQKTQGTENQKVENTKKGGREKKVRHGRQGLCESKKEAKKGYRKRVEVDKGRSNDR